MASRLDLPVQAWRIDILGGDRIISSSRAGLRVPRRDLVVRMSSVVAVTRFIFDNFLVGLLCPRTDPVPEKNKTLRGAPNKALHAVKS